MRCGTRLRGGDEALPFDQASLGETGRRDVQPWLDITSAGLAERSLIKWQGFVAATQTRATAHVLDGQLFHGDLTNLILMDAGSAAIRSEERRGGKEW